MLEVPPADKKNTRDVFWRQGGGGRPPDNDDSDNDENDDDEDDPNFGLCSRIETEIEAGQYAIVVTGYDDEPVRAYGLETSIMQNVSDGGRFDGTFVNGGDDTYRFELAEDRTVEFETTGQDRCPGDTIITVFSVGVDGSREQVARNDDGSRQAPEVGVGDKVLYSKYAGTDIKLGSDEYVLLSEKDILAVVN